MGLREEDWETLRRASARVFTNPFARRRRELDDALAGQPIEDDQERYERALARVEAALERLGSKTLADYSGTNRETLEHAVVFMVFHRFAEPMEHLIECQLEEPEAPIEFAAGPDIVADLVRQGFHADRAERLLGVFFQMRRAYDFIDRQLVGRCASMERLRQSLWDNLFTSDVGRYEQYLVGRMEDFSTILLGETGSGKGRAAAAIGHSGHIPWVPKHRRFAEPFTRVFLPINLSQFPDTLIESELFGHRKGAFTGAVEAHAGIFERASEHGSIFLDEIGELGIPVQIKLLKVLQERVFTPVGSHESKRFSGRVIAATHQSMTALREQGRFRDDFYYRLCSDVIEVPSLRERVREDAAELDLLLHHVVETIVGIETGRAQALHTQIRRALARDLGPDYDWPGNVRELEQCVRRILLTGRCERDGATRGGATGLRDEIHRGIDAGDLEARELVAAYCKLLYERYGTYEEVSRRAGLDRRTVKKNVDAA